MFQSYFSVREIAARAAAVLDRMIEENGGYVAIVNILGEFKAVATDFQRRAEAEDGFAVMLQDVRGCTSRADYLGKAEANRMLAYQLHSINLQLVVYSIYLDAIRHAQTGDKGEAWIGAIDNILAGLQQCPLLLLKKMGSGDVVSPESMPEVIAELERGIGALRKLGETEFLPHLELCKKNLAIFFKIN